MSDKEKIKLPELPEWSKCDDLGGRVPSEIRDELLSFYKRGYENGSPSELWKEIFQLRQEVKGPDGYETWKDEAIEMKMELAALKQSLAQPAPPTEAQRDERALFEEWLNQGHHNGANESMWKAWQAAIASREGK